MDEGVERALWAALRALEEKAALARKLMGAPGGGGVPIVTSIYGKRLREAEENARALRRMLGADKARAVTAAGRRSHRRAAGSAPGNPDEAAPE
jgi:two-component system chemotaxis response regulator CheB